MGASPLLTLSTGLADSLQQCSSRPAVTTLAAGKELPGSGGLEQSSSWALITTLTGIGGELTVSGLEQSSGSALMVAAAWEVPSSSTAARGLPLRHLLLRGESASLGSGSRVEALASRGAAASRGRGRLQGRLQQSCESGTAAPLLR